eukprot:NODE_104_length_19952_cov_0.449000.p6 type:complete len:289 gc:universal NODE_104_length_19952_cov_0.449000:944-1810(+)
MKIIDGKKIASTILDSLKSHVHNSKPTLAIIHVGNRADSASYIKMKQNAAKKIGFECQIHCYEETIDQSHLLSHIEAFNNDESIHGIIVQLPLPKAFSAIEVLNAVNIFKDVDGLHRENIGRLSSRMDTPLFIPCTARGILHLVKSTEVELKGCHCVIVGISDLVGRPVGQLLLREGCTVTFCHSKTKQLPSFINMADILIVAIGSPEFIRGEWIKDNAVVIDVGCNAVDGSDSFKLVGDINYESACRKASFITPVPGGVGPMTVAMLMKNLSESEQRKSEALKLKNK